MSPGRAGAQRPRQVPAGGYGQFPLSYFDHLPLCLSPMAYVVVGQVLRRTRWGDGAISRDQKRDWCGILQRDFAEKLGITKRCLQKALDEAESAGCLVSRKADKPGRGMARLDYACAVENFLKVPCRKLSRSGNPAPGPKPTEAVETLPVVLACPEGLECRVDQLVQLDDGTLTNEPLMKTKKKQVVKANSCSPTDGKGKPDKANSCSPIRPRVRQIAEQFTPRLGAGPADDILLVIQRVLGNASDEQFATAVAAKAAKVRSYKLLVHIAQDCADTAPAWNRQHASAPARQDGEYTCADCGKLRTWRGGCACEAQGASA